MSCFQLNINLKRNFITDIKSYHVISKTSLIKHSLLAHHKKSLLSKDEEVLG